MKSYNNELYRKEFFQQQPINTVQNIEMQVLFICLDDLCAVLKRANMINNGHAMRLCPSSLKRVIRKKGREMWFIDPIDIHNLVQPIRKENKQIAKLCDELENWVYNLPLECKPPIFKKNPLNIEPVVISYQDQPITFKSEDGITYVNATQMARKFNKNPREWLLLAETSRLRESLVHSGKSANLESQIITKRGQQGSTWIQEDMAIAFSQWLSPEFSVWCNSQLQQLMTKGYSVLSNEKEDNTYSFDPGNPDHKLPMPNNLTDALRFMLQQQEVIEKQHQQIESEKPKVEFYNNFIENREWFKTSFIAEELQISVLQLNRFLAEQKICKYDPKKKQWVVYPNHSALQCMVPYLWTNKKGQTYGYGPVARWTHVGREFILDLWNNNN